MDPFPSGYPIIARPVSTLDSSVGGAEYCIQPGHHNTIDAISVLAHPTHFTLRNTIPYSDKLPTYQQALITRRGGLNQSRVSRAGVANQAGG
jgi:hypothetical protein